MPAEPPQHDGRVTEAPEEEFWRAIKLDLFGTFLCSKIAIPEIAKSGGGSIINMSSIVALMAMPGRDCYTAAKGGISALTRSMAVEYAADRIRVNAIAPSVTLSDRVKKQLEGNPVTEELGRQHLLGLIEPIYIADMAVYLASEKLATDDRSNSPGRQRRHDPLSIPVSKSLELSDAHWLSRRRKHGAAHGRTAARCRTRAVDL